jgi:hypothetical protein
MKSFAGLFVPFIIFLALFACGEPGEKQPSQDAPASSREYYQLKTYQFTSEAQQQVTDQYLAEALLPALKRLNFGPVGVFKNRLSETDTIRKTYVLIPFASMEQFLSLENKLNEDTRHQTAGKAYLTAPHDNPPYQRIESALMQAFVDMPQMKASGVKGPKSERVYELRSYESATEALYRNKVDMFNAGGEIKLFDRLDFNAVFYAEVLSGSKMPNLMYMTTFSDMATRDSLWDTFRVSPEWTVLKADEKYQNNVSHADIWLLYPAEYSDY